MKWSALRAAATFPVGQTPETPQPQQAGPQELSLRQQLLLPRCPPQRFQEPRSAAAQ